METGEREEGREGGGEGGEVGEVAEGEVCAWEERGRGALAVFLLVLSHPSMPPMVFLWRVVMCDRKQGRPANRWEDDLNIYLQPDRSNRDNTALTSNLTWLTTAEDSSKWDAMKSDFISSRLKQPARPTTPNTTTTTTHLTTHDQTTGTTQSHDQNEDNTKDDDEQERRQRYASHPLSIHRLLNHIKHTRSKMEQQGFLMTHSY